MCLIKREVQIFICQIGDFFLVSRKSIKPAVSGKILLVGFQYSAKMKICALVTVLLVVAVAEAANETMVKPPVVNTTADLINLNVIQMDKEIDNAQGNIDLLQIRYDDKLNVVGQNQQLLQDEIIRLNERLDLSVTESSYKKVCVEKYRNEIATPKAVQAAIEACVATGRAKSAGLVATARAQLTNAISRKTSFVTGANNCIKSQQGVYNQTTCLTTQIEYWRGVFKSDLVSLNNELESQLCLSTSYTKITQQCVSTYISGVFGTMNKASYKIQGCFEGKDESVPCVYSNGIIALV